MQCQIFALFCKNAIACVPAMSKEGAAWFRSRNDLRGRELSQESRIPRQQGIKTNTC